MKKRRGIRRTPARKTKNQKLKLYIHGYFCELACLFRHQAA
jgi:hypothetical protein